MAKRMTVAEQARAEREFIQKARLRINRRAKPSVNETTILYLRIPASLKIGINEFCAEEKRSLNTVCTELLEKALAERGY